MAVFILSVTIIVADLIHYGLSYTRIIGDQSHLTSG